MNLRSAIDTVGAEGGDGLVNFIFFTADRYNFILHGMCQPLSTFDIIFTCKFLT